MFKLYLTAALLGTSSLCIFAAVTTFAAEISSNFYQFLPSGKTRGFSEMGSFYDYGICIYIGWVSAGGLLLRFEVDPENFGEAKLNLSHEELAKVMS